MEPTIQLESKPLPCEDDSSPRLSDNTGIVNSGSLKRKSRQNLGVLKVQNDALRVLEGDDAMADLWFLFTKCKSVLPDGHRLENLCWRLWSAGDSKRVGQRILSSLLNSAPIVRADSSSLSPPKPILHVTHPTPNPTPPATPSPALRGNPNVPSHLSLPPSSIYPPCIYPPEDDPSDNPQRPRLSPSSPAASSDTSITSLMSLFATGSDTSYTSAEQSHDHPNAPIPRSDSTTDATRQEQDNLPSDHKAPCSNSVDQPQRSTRSSSSSQKTYSTTSRVTSSSSRSRSRSRDRYKKRGGRASGLLGMTSINPHTHRIIPSIESTSGGGGERPRAQFDIGSQGSGSGSSTYELRSRNEDDVGTTTTTTTTTTVVKPPSRRASTTRGLSAMMHAQMTMTPATPPLPSSPPPPPSPQLILEPQLPLAKSNSPLSTAPTQNANQIPKTLTFSGVANGLGLNAPSANNDQMRNQLEALFQIRDGVRGLPSTNNIAATRPGTLAPPHPLALAARGQTQGQGNTRLIISTSESDSEDGWTDEETGTSVSDEEESVGTVSTAALPPPPPLPASVPVPAPVATAPSPPPIPSNKQPGPSVISRDDEENSDDYEDVTPTSTDDEEEEEEQINVVTKNNRPHVSAATPRRGKHARRASTGTNGGTLKKEKEKEKEKDKEREKDKDAKVLLPRNVSTRQLANHHHHHQRPAAHIPPYQQQQNQKPPPAPQQPQPRTGKGGGRSQVQQPAPSVNSAALEAQRQREMFQKQPTRSYSGNLNRNGPRRPGLLSQLMNPDPQIFPAEHPYRRGYSSGDVASSRVLPRVGVRGLGVTPLEVIAPSPAVERGLARGNTEVPTRSVSPVSPTPSSSVAAPPPQSKVNGHRKTSSQGSVKPPLMVMKSLAAQPVAQSVNAASVASVKSNGSLSSKVHFQDTDVSEPPAIVAQRQGGGGGVRPPIRRTHTDNGGVMPVRQPPPGLNGKRYQPKGRPQEAEMEDTSSDESDDERAARDRIQLSKSVAQEKLKALAERRGIVAKPGPVNAPQPQQQRHRELDVEPGNNGEAIRFEDLPHELRKEIQRHRSGGGDESTPHSNRHSGSTTPAAQPLPVALAQLVYPYNLPQHAEPSSPRTTRQLMLRTELTESLRHNLLWTRQLQKNDVIGPRRRSGGAIASTHGFRPEPIDRNSDILKPVVQLTAKKPQPDRRSSDGETFDPLGGLSKEETRRVVLTRNKSFAGLYHNPGW